MGTNYYLHGGPACESCGHRDGELLHIGKSSAGWAFGLHVLPEEGLSSLEDWRRAWGAPGATIEDEYGSTVTPEQMLGVITQRTGRGIPHDPKFLEGNHAVEGPDFLLRSRVDGQYCVGHGEGTWDLMAGEFC